MVKIGNISVGEFPLLLAPMEDVSDPPFRALCKAYGADVVYTEFISSEGLIRNAETSLQKLDIFPEERPVGIQIFGAELEPMRQSARIVESVQPEILDINFGCPVHNVACKGAGAGILKDIPKMEMLTREIVRSTGLPVTVKTRLGWDEKTIRIQEVVLRLQDAGIKAISIHGRTRAQMYKGQADWTLIEEVAAHPDVDIPVFGNGDVDTPQKALLMRRTYPSVSGVMIGRAAIGAPWVFRDIKHYFATGELLPLPEISERVEVARRHLQMSIDWKGESLAIVEMRRHYAGYFKGIPFFKPLRLQLVTANSAIEVFDLLEYIRENLSAEGAPAAPEAPVLC